MTVQTRTCSLEAALGRAETCPEGACAFWEPGGAALEGRCAFERLDLAGDTVLAAWLLELRARPASARSAGDEEALGSLFHRLLNESTE